MIQIGRVYKGRENMIESGQGLDWGMAETLAWATLLDEKVRRSSGGSAAAAVCPEKLATVCPEKCLP